MQGLIDQIEKQRITEEIGGKEKITSTLFIGTETPDGPLSFDILANEVEKFLPNTKTALKLLLAVATSGIRKNRVMLWLLFVGFPSSGKTELLRLIRKVPTIIGIDSLTLNSFISGERETQKQRVYDLLPRLDGKCLTIKDWTVIFSHDERMTKKIIGDMVGAYDKSLEKSSSQRGIISYESEFSHLGAITPATLNKHHNYLNMIGPRFLFYTIPNLDQAQEDKSFKAIFAKEDRKAQEDKVSVMLFDYLTFLNEQDITQIEPPSKETQEYLKTAARFLARGRGIVVIHQSTFKNEEGADVTYYEPSEIQIEQPFRAVQQLLTLAEYLALVEGKKEITEQELEIIKEVTLSSMPADRAQALKALRESENGEITAKQLSDGLDKSIKTSRRLLDELNHLGVVEKVKGSGQTASSYKVKGEFESFVLHTPREFMSHNYRGTEKTDTTSDEQLALGKSVFGEGTKWANKE